MRHWDCTGPHMLADFPPHIQLWQLGVQNILQLYKSFCAIPIALYVGSLLRRCPSSQKIGHGLTIFGPTVQRPHPMCGLRDMYIVGHPFYRFPMVTLNNKHC